MIEMAYFVAMAWHKESTASLSMKSSDAPRLLEAMA
jgi:hypothetical protein